MEHSILTILNPRSKVFVYDNSISPSKELYVSWNPEIHYYDHKSLSPIVSCISLTRSICWNLVEATF